MYRGSHEDVYKVPVAEQAEISAKAGGEKRSVTVKISVNNNSDASHYSSTSKCPRVCNHKTDI